MNKKIIWLVTVLLLATGTFAEAQQPGKVLRIGFLMNTSPSAISDRLEAFRQGLSELGYMEGKNIVIDHALCALPSGRGAATNESPPDRISNCPHRHRILPLAEHGGIPSRAARPWMDGGEEYHD